MYPPTINTIPLYNGCNVDMISICLGEIVLPTITSIAMMKFGMYAYLKFFAETMASATNENSRANASTKNLGSPNGIPNAPVMQTAARTKTTPFRIWIISDLKCIGIINKINCKTWP